MRKQVARSLMFSLLVSVSVSAEAQKVSTVVLAVSAKHQPLAGRVAVAIDDALAGSRDVYRWRDLVAARPESTTAVNTLKQKTQEALNLIKTKYPNKAPIGDIQDAMKAAAPSVSTGDEQQAEAALAAVAWALNDVKTSELRLNEALAPDPSLPPIEVTEPPGFADLWERTRFAINDHARGELTIRSDPPGARVTIDGVTRGTTPVVVHGLLVGPHLVQLDLFGRALAGEIVRVVGSEGSWSAKLPTVDYVNDADLKKAVAAAAEKKPQAIADIAKAFDLTTIMVGSISAKGSQPTLFLAAIDVENKKIIASQSITLDEDEYGQAAARASSLASNLIEGKTGGVKGANDEKSKEKDPLGRDGTEDW